jgi:hypothetical protein
MSHIQKKAWQLADDAMRSRTASGVSKVVECVHLFKTKCCCQGSKWHAREIGFPFAAWSMMSELDPGSTAVRNSIYLATNSVPKGMQKEDIPPSSSSSSSAVSKKQPPGARSMTMMIADSKKHLVPSFSEYVESVKGLDRLMSTQWTCDRENLATVLSLPFRHLVLGIKVFLNFRIELFNFL